MNKGDLYSSKEDKSVLALVTKVFNRRDFGNDLNSFHGFPSISIVPCVKVLLVTGSGKGISAVYELVEFYEHYSKVSEVTHDCR